MFAKSNILDPGDARLLINPNAHIRSTLDRDDEYELNAGFVHRLMKLRREMRRENQKQIGKSRKV